MNQGLLNKSISNEAAEIDHSMPKIVVLAVLGIIFSFLFAYFLKLAILEIRWDFLLYSSLFSIGFLSLCLLDVFFIKSFRRLSLIVFLENLGLAIAFYDYFSYKLLLAVLMSFLFFSWANQSGLTELENSLQIKFFRIGKKVLPKAIAGLALFASVILVITMSTAGGKEFFISQAVFEKIVSPIIGSKIIQDFLPGFDFSLPVEKLINNLAVNQIQENPQSKLLSETAKNQLVNQTAKELEKKISDSLGAPINPKNKASTALYELAVLKFRELPENIQRLMPIGFGAFIFLTIISLSLPIRWLVSFLSFLFYEICLALGFSVIMTENRSREIILLK